MTARNESLPLPDFDQLPVGSVAARIRSLDHRQVEELIQYERDHAGRVQVLELLRHRRDQLRDGAEPTGGDPAAPKPELADAPASGSVVGAESGPAINPPTGGDPTNPTQPRT